MTELTETGTKSKETRISEGVTTVVNRDVKSEMVTVEKDYQHVNADVEFKEFWRNPERFADLINGVIFRGKQRISASDLTEADVEASGIIEYADSKESITRTRDIMKLSIENGLRFAMWGIENQKELDNTMPLRVMVYDGQGYLKETKDKEYKGILTPLITLVLYYGTPTWTGPRCLTDMMDGATEEIKDVVSEYKMNIVEVLGDKQYVFHNQDVKLVFEYARTIIKKDRKRLEELNAEYKVSKEVFYMLVQILDSKNIREAIKFEEKIGRGELNMCEYFMELREEGKIEGLKSMVCSLRELNITTEIILNQVMKQFELSEVEAKKYI